MPFLCAMDEVLNIGLRGMQDGFQRAAKDADRIVRAFQGDQPDDAVRSIVDLQIDQRQVQASARIIQVGGQLIGSLLDIYA